MCDSGIEVSNFSKCQLTREPGWLVVPALGSDCGSGGTREGCQLSSHLYEPPARPTHSPAPRLRSPDPSGHGALDCGSFLSKLPFLGLVEFAQVRAWGGGTWLRTGKGFRQTWSKQAGHSQAVCAWVSDFTRAAQFLLVVRSNESIPCTGRWEVVRMPLAGQYGKSRVHSGLRSPAGSAVHRHSGCFWESYTLCWARELFLFPSPLSGFFTSMLETGVRCCRGRGGRR